MVEIVKEEQCPEHTTKYSAVWSFLALDLKYQPQKARNRLWCQQGFLLPGCVFCPRGLDLGYVDYTPPF